MTNREDLIRTAVVGEMVAERIVASDGGVLVYPYDAPNPEFMVEVKVFDMRESESRNTAPTEVGLIKTTTPAREFYDASQAPKLVEEKVTPLTDDD